MKPEGKGRQRVSTVLSELEAAAREDLAASWSGRLRAAWQEEIERVLKARAAEMLPRLQAAVQFEVGWRLAAELDAAAPEVRERARRELTAHLNAALRRLVRSASEPEWSSALLDAAAPFASRVLLFTVEGDSVAGAGVRVPLSQAPAFANAIESRDTVIALRAAGELSEEIAALGGASNHPRCCLFPVVSPRRVTAVLYAEGEVDANALELIASVAGSAVKEPVTPLVTIAAAPERETTLDEERARQYARVRVAEMLLHQSDAVRSGRERRNLYAALREEIDSARDVYARKFASEQDHLHAELVRTLAKGDAESLGADYPGPLGSRRAR